MAELKIIEEKPVTMSELKEELKIIKERDAELGFRTAKVFEQTEILKLPKLKEVEEISKKIEKLAIPRFKELHIAKIIDLMPANMIEMKNIIQGYGLTVTNENLQKILDIIVDYLPKKKT